MGACGKMRVNAQFLQLFLLQFSRLELLHNKNLYTHYSYKICYKVEGVASSNWILSSLLYVQKEATRDCIWANCIEFAFIINSKPLRNFPEIIH